MTVPDTVDCRRLIRASAPSFVHSLDSCLLRRVINKMPCDVIPIHDSCGLLPSQVLRLKETVAVEMANIIGTDGRHLLRNYLYELVPEGEDRDELEQRLDETFPMTHTTPFAENIKQARYCWN